MVNKPETFPEIFADRLKEVNFTVCDAFMLWCGITTLAFGTSKGRFHVFAAFRTVWLSSYKNEK